MTVHQQTIVSDDDLANELAAARRSLTTLLDDVLQFSTLFYERPWVALDDLLAEVRAAATTVAALERLVARTD